MDLKNLCDDLNVNLKNIKTNNYIDFEEKMKLYAKKLMSNFCLKVNGEVYYLTEIEFYYYNKFNHPDPYVHMEKEQLESGCFYFHGSGFDITFGNKENNSYGGILIRGIKTYSVDKPYVNGPINLIKYILGIKGDYSAKLNEKEYLSKQIAFEYIGSKLDKKVFNSTRVGLQPHPLDFELIEDNIDNKIFMPFIFRRYSFIVDMVTQHKYPQKTKFEFYASKKGEAKRPNYRQDSKIT